MLTDSLQLLLLGSCADDHLPNVDDVLRLRQRSTDIFETRFNMGQLSIYIFDVAGQRKK